MRNGEWRAGEIRRKTTGMGAIWQAKRKWYLGLKSQTLRNLWAPVLEAHLHSGYSTQQNRQVVLFVVSESPWQQSTAAATRQTWEAKDGAKMYPGCSPPHLCSGCPHVYLLPRCWQPKVLAEDSPWWLPSPAGCHFLGTWVGCVCTGICTHALPTDMHRVWFQSIPRVSSRARTYFY